jgi:hypothetical protein
MEQVLDAVFGCVEEKGRHGAVLVLLAEKLQRRAALRALAQRQAVLPRETVNAKIVAVAMVVVVVGNPIPYRREEDEGKCHRDGERRHRHNLHQPGTRTKRG